VVKDGFVERMACREAIQNHKKIIAKMEDLPTPQEIPTSFAIAE